MIFGGGILVIVLLVVVLGLSAKDVGSKKPGNNMVLKLIYTFLIGIFLAVFVGVGIAAFYPGPKFPEAPAIVKYGSPEIIKGGEQSAETKELIEKFDKEEREYQTKSQIYNRDVSVYALIASIIIVIASLTLFRTILLIADGLLLGGVLTLIYSVIRGFGTNDNMFRFVVVSFGLFISLILGYVKFIQPAKKHSSK